MPRAKKVVDAMAPKEFTDAMIAGFEEPQKAVHNIQQVIEMYSNEAETTRLQLEQLQSKLQHLTEIRDMLERRASQQEEEDRKKRQKVA